MIRVNVIIDNPKWKKKSINLNKYIKKNISILSKIPKFKKKIIISRFYLPTIKR